MSRSLRIIVKLSFYSTFLAIHQRISHFFVQEREYFPGINSFVNYTKVFFIHSHESKTALLPLIAQALELRQFPFSSMPGPFPQCPSTTSYLHPTLKIHLKCYHPITRRIPCSQTIYFILKLSSCAYLKLDSQFLEGAVSLLITLEVCDQQMELR